MRLASYEELLERSLPVDHKWSTGLASPGFDPRANEPLLFSIPANHPRYSTLPHYKLVVQGLSQFSFKSSDLLLIDKAVEPYLATYKDKVGRFLVFNPIEGELKTLDYLDDLANKLTSENQRIVAVGGGIILNCAAYIAEKLSLDLVLVPTTVLSMSDTAVGGKVRVNKIENGSYVKHAYKSFYEPSLVIIDPDFLSYLSTDQIQIGLAEIIKHAIYQSPGLTSYLLSDRFNPFKDMDSLLLAILWTVELKRVSLEGDPNEEAGGQMILRAAHNLSDKLEEQSKFSLSHGEAVLRAMSIDVRGNPTRESVLKEVYSKIGIAIEDLD